MTQLKYKNDFEIYVTNNDFGLIILIPQLSLQFRRLRDAGIHPAWGLLSCIGLVPILTFFSFIGSIVLIVMSCQPTKPAPETLFDKVE